PGSPAARGPATRARPVPPAHIRTVRSLLTCIPPTRLTVAMQPRWDFVRLVSAALPAYALVGGLVSFSGWALGIPRFIDWWDTGISIKTNTAVCIALLALALLLHLLWQLRIVALGAASLAGIIALATLL